LFYSFDPAIQQVKQREHCKGIRIHYQYSIGGLELHIQFNKSNQSKVKNMDEFLAFIILGSSLGIVERLFLSGPKASMIIEGPPVGLSIYMSMSKF